MIVYLNRLSVILELILHPCYACILYACCFLLLPEYGHAYFILDMRIHISVFVNDLKTLSLP